MVMYIMEKPLKVIHYYFDPLKFQSQLTMLAFRIPHATCDGNTPYSSYNKNNHANEEFITFCF